MATNDWLLPLIIGIVLLHFVVGIGYLVWKISTAKPRASAHQREDSDKV